MQATPTECTTILPTRPADSETFCFRHKSGPRSDLSRKNMHFYRTRSLFRLDSTCLSESRSQQGLNMGLLRAWVSQWLALRRAELYALGTPAQSVHCAKEPSQNRGQLVPKNLLKMGTEPTTRGANHSEDTVNRPDRTGQSTSRPAGFDTTLDNLQ